MRIKKSSRKTNDSKRDIRSRRDIASIGVHDEKPSVLSILPRNSQQDVSMGCDENNCRSCAKDDAADVAHNDIENIGESSEQLFYEVSVLDASVTPDQLRSELHDALDMLSYVLGHTQLFLQIQAIVENPYVVHWIRTKRYICL